MVRKQKRKTKKTRLRSGWLKRYDFAYAIPGTINTVLRTLKSIAPGLIQNTANQVYSVAHEKNSH